MNVWVGDVARSLDSAKAITHDTQRGIMHFVWTRDSRYVLFEQDRDGDENFHLFRADPLHPDAKAVDLTPMAGARAEVIDLPRGRPGEAVVAINGRDKRYFDAYRLDLEPGELQLLEENPRRRRYLARRFTRGNPCLHGPSGDQDGNPRARLRLGTVSHIGYLHG